jgi:hypothetical protein
MIMKEIKITLESIEGMLDCQHELRLRWVASGLTQNQIKIRELIFYIDLAPASIKMLITGILFAIKNIERSRTEEDFRSIFIKLISCNNEELTGLLGEQKYEWKQSGLTQKQINRKEVVLFLEFYREKFTCWIGWDRIQVRLRIK